MDVRDCWFGLTTGPASCLVVGTLVTAPAFAGAEFSLFGGYLVDPIVGSTVLAFVALGIVVTVSPSRRRLAVAAGVFALMFLLVVVVEGVALSRPPRIVFPVALVVGTGFGLLAYLRAGG